MRIRMKTRAAGPDQSRVFMPGDIVEMPDETAIAWLEGGYAEVVKAECETATVEPPERALGLGAEPVTTIRGIGKATAAKLEGMLSISSVGALARASANAVAEAASVNEEKAGQWIADAIVLCEEDDDG